LPIRIISGGKRGLKLFLPASPGFRPTQAKVREAVFSVLAGAEAGARVLDLYAGSGSMGWEALSRGAASAAFCDDSAAALGVLRQNARLFPKNADQVRILQLCLPDGLPRLRDLGPFGLIFMDPPYGLGLTAGGLIPLLSSLGLAGPSAALVWEMDARDLGRLDPEGYRPWELIKGKAWGRKAAAFFRLPEAGEKEDEGKPGEGRPAGGLPDGLKP
jgi:16S rRNA (guanine966-N2)-methyltransferase